MAVLMRPDEQCQSLGHRTLVGRAAYCGVVLSDPRVSAEHASIYFDKGTWYLRDLASTNGTFLDGVKIDLGRKHPLVPGSIIGFGAPTPAYRFVSDEPPRMRLRNQLTGARVEPQLGLVVLPDESHPVVTIFQGLDGWYEEREGAVRQLTDFAKIQIEDQIWSIELPPPGAETAQTGLARMGGWANFDDLFLRFDVSRDRESIVLFITAGSDSRAITNRAYHELLLVLAEARIASATDGTPELEQGWLHTDELCRRIAGDVSKVNVDVFRARQQLDQLGIIESHRIVERRPNTRQLRLGTAAVTINYDVASMPPTCTEEPPS
ncbi:MAG TPA: FHA domain-containing protein [Polyangiaceae bacterium]|nr:FHA domain-containing protein [Polyangiaceae bacterium]